MDLSTITSGATNFATLKLNGHTSSHTHHPAAHHTAGHTSTPAVKKATPAPAVTCKTPTSIHFMDGEGYTSMCYQYTGCPAVLDQLKADNATAKKNGDYTSTLVNGTCLSVMTGCEYLEHQHKQPAKAAAARYGLVQHAFYIKTHRGDLINNTCSAPPTIEPYTAALDTAMLGDVMHSAYGKGCIQFEGKLIENPETRTTLDLQLESHHLKLVAGSCGSAGFAQESDWRRQAGGVAITLW